VASGLKSRSFNPRRKTARPRAVFVFAVSLCADFSVRTRPLRHAYNVALIELHVEEIHA
jgi:hypothetical protein